MAGGPWDDYAPSAAKKPSAGPWEDYAPEQAPEPPKAGALRQISDVGVAGLQGVVGGAKSIADFAGANNKVSSLLSTANDGLQSVLSEPRRAEIATRQRAVEAADASGSTIDSITSRLGGFAEAPVSTIAQGLGSTLPTIAAVALPSTRSAVARQVIGAGVGAAQGAGSVKGGIYDAVKQAKIDAGATPAEADAAAEEAQRFDGANARQVALGGALGAVAASSGAERLVDGLVHGVTKTPKNLLPRVAAGAAAEALPEGAQGSQQQLAQNLALTNSGTPTDPMKGVIGAGVLDAAVSAPIGAGFAAPRPRDTTAAQPVTEVPPAADPVPGASTPPPVDPVLDTPPPAAAPAPGDPLRAAKLPDAGPLSRGINTLIEGEAQAADAGAPVQTPVAGALAGVPAEDAAPKIPVGEATEVDPIPAGEATELPADQVQPAAGPTFDPATGEITQPQRATFPTREAVDEYLRQARLQQGGERAKAAPVELPDGSFSFLRPNEPGYEEALTASKQTVLQRKRAAAAKSKAEAEAAKPPTVLQQRRAAAASGAASTVETPSEAPAGKPLSVLQQRRAAAAATREKAGAALMAPAVKAPNVLQQRRAAAAAAREATAQRTATSPAVEADAPAVAPAQKPLSVLQQRRAAALAAKQNAGAPAADTGALGSAPSVATPPTAPAPTTDDTNQPRRVSTEAQAPADQAQPPARGDGAARVAEPAVAGPAAVQAAGVAQPARKTPKKVAAAQAERETKRADYFAPGNVLKGYGGMDRVLDYRPQGQGAREGAWEVQVQRVVKQGDDYVPAPNESPRWHSTEPDAKEMAAGPVLRAPTKKPDAASADGPFGPILRQFRGDAQGAIKALRELENGEAVAALNHPDIGDIDLVWGEAGTKESNGSGLAKLVKWHPEVLDNLQQILTDMKVTSRTENRVQLASETHKAAVRLEWDGQAKTWLLTAFEKKGAGNSTTTDTAATKRGGDTARPATGTGSSVANDATKRSPAAPKGAQNTTDGGESFDLGDQPAKPDTAAYGPASQAHRDVAAELQQRLRATFPGVVLDAVAPRVDTGGTGGGGRGERGVPGEREASVAEVAKRLFKREVVFVKFDGPSRFNGAVSDAFPGKIFLSVDSEKPLMAVLGHELIHSMRGGNPVVYEALKRRLTGLLKNEQQYIDKLDAKYAARGVSPAKVRHGEELHGDIVGDFFMDPLFWQDMAKDKPGLFRRVANAVIKFLDNAAKRITNLKPFGSEDYLADIAAARRAVATTMREFSEVTAPEASLPGSEENFSLADALTSGINNVKAVKLPAGYLVQDLFNRTGKLHWWHKTVGTMNNLAQRSPEFKRVYDATQSFINDVSAYGTAAADLAPTILPKLEGWKDIVAKPLSPADTKAISAPIFEGTLTWARDGKGRPVKLASLEDAASGMSAQDKAQAMLRDGKVGSDELKRWQNLPIDSYEGAIRNRYEREYLTAGVVWKDAELRSMFGLNDKQIGLYKEFRAATDKSLTNLAISDMLRYGGDDVAAVRQAALDAPDIDAAAELLRDHLFAQAKANPDRADVLNSTGNGMIDKADKAKSLMQRGYAPLSRFGQYTVYVTEGDEQRYFGMFESAAEASRMARRMKAEFPGATVQQGTVSQEAYKLFAGVSPETLELFGGMLGLETQGGDASSQAFQTYLKLAKSNRSAMKRLIQRKGIAGFSEDAGRVLAGFVYSNARQTSSNLHMGEMTKAASDVSKGEGEMKDQAVRLVDYVKNPQEEAQALRGLLFAQYLGGSVASAMVNMTQPFAVTFPYLSQYGGAVKAGKQMSRALADVYKKQTGDAALDAALKKAERDGIVSPQEVHQLQAQAQGRGSLKAGDGTLTGFAAAKASNAVSKFSLGWGKLFSTAEQFNRRITFIAAYRTAIDQGIADPAAFAADVVNQTQFTYNKGNKPAWARGAIGGTLFTFKQYSISYVELMARLWKSGPEGKKAAALGIVMLMLMSGLDELPFTEDVDDLIDGFMQRFMGYNFSTKQEREQFVTNLLGEGGGRFVLKGVSGLAGVPVDLSGRLGMGNLLPGTGLLAKKNDYSRDLGEFAGPAGDFAKRIFQGVGKVLGGDVGEGALSVSPVAGRNIWKAYDMWTTGMYRDDKGRKVIDTDGFEAASKLIGFQPNSVARVQDATGQKQQMIALNKIREAEIADDWAQGVFEKDDGKIADARAALRDWNVKNPESPIRINPGQVMKRVRSMREDKATRIAKTAPKEIRAAVRADLAVANQ